jgi:hypothetical protein
VATARDSTIVVSGHGPVGDRKALVAFPDMLVASLEKVAALKSKWMSLEQVIAARPTAAFDEKRGKFVVRPDLFTRVVYEGA